MLGRSFSIEKVAALLGETPARLLPDVEAALGADLLVATPDSLMFGRELVWRALAESVPRPPVLFCSDGEARVVVRRETYEDLTARDV